MSNYQSKLENSNSVKNFSSEKNDKKRFNNRLTIEKIGSWRRSRGTKGGRRFTSTCLILAKDEEKNSVSYAYAGGKEPIVAFKKSVFQAKKNLVNYFNYIPRTIPRDILVKYKSTTLFLKPAPAGSGIKAGGSLIKLFKLLGIKDISSKIIGSRRNKINIIKAAIIALEKLTNKNNYGRN